MAGYTAGDQINRALRILGILAEGEAPSASTSVDALMALNQMIDSWNTERLSVFSTTDQTIIWPAGQINESLGPTGTLVGFCPVALDDSSYYVVNGISYQIDIINEDQYNAIPLKTVTSPIPSLLYVDNTYPNMSMVLYPVPTVALEFHFISVTPLAQPALLATALLFPPGYLRAFTYNLAVEIASEFGADVAKAVRDIATVSKRNIKRINNPDDKMSMPSGLAGGNYGVNIFSGK